MIIIPIVGGHYRFKWILGDGKCSIGVFVAYFGEEDQNTFLVHRYVEANTPANQVPEILASLCGLPDLKRHVDIMNIINIKEINILERLYICKDSVFQERRVQWRLGMRNLYRISDTEDDDFFSFIGHDRMRASARYINEELEYLVFKLGLVEVNNILFQLKNVCFLTT